MAFKVFITYSTRDLTRAKEVQKLLARPACTVFLAETSIAPGRELTTAIIKAIKQCDVFILLWSHHAKTSEWVPQEIGIARSDGKPIIPIVLHASADPTGFLRGTKYLPLYKNPATALKWLQRHVFAEASAKEKRDGPTWLGLGAAFLWLFSQDTRDADA